MGKVISTIIVCLLAPIFFVFVFFLSLKLTVMNPDFVKKELSEQKAYEKIHANLLEAVSVIGKKDEVNPEDQGALTSAEMTAAIQKTVTPETAKKNTELVIDVFWPWMLSGKSENSTVNMKEMKAQARTGIMDAFKSKYESLPYCLNSNDFSESNIVCRPRGVKFDDIMSQISNDPTKSPFGAIDNIPDSLSPDILIAGSSGSMAKVESVRSPAKTAAYLFYLLPVFLLAVFTLLARLFAGSWKKTSEALGIFFIILGSVSLFFGFLVSKFGFSGIPVLLDKNLEDMPGLKAQLIVPLVKDILSKVYGTINTVSISVLVTGIVLVGGSIILLGALSKDNQSTAPKK